MSQLTKYIIAAVATAIVLFLVWYFSDIVAYILVSAVLAIIGKPLVDMLLKVKIRSRTIPRWLAALVALLVIWAVAVLFITFFVPLVFNKVSQISNMDISTVVQAFSEPLQSLQEFIERVFAVQNDNFSLANELTQQFSKLLNLDMINSALTSTVTIIASTVIALFSITFITYYFLKQENLFQNMLVSVFPKRHEEKIVHALGSVTKLLIRYFTGILAESTIVMLLLSIILLIWGFPADTAFFMGFVVGILNVIPYIGPIIGAVVCIIMGVVTPLGDASILQMMLIIGGSVVCVQLVDNFVLQPVLYSNRVKAHPLEIFIVILIAGNLAGVLGMLLAIPSYTVLRVFAKEFFSQFPLVQRLTEHMD